ncbi:replication initiation protein [Muricoccus aerilatus]|uniref:replication initiation protein n=1 Tax=Muricoccus aerilatus TaxID=452982 RepID=UPI0005C1F723|nr:replication initiation protein [Roseomonas aerilata]
MPPEHAAAFGLPEWTASWWIGREGELHAALNVAGAAAPHLRDLALLLLPRLPHQVRASSSIKGEGEHEFSRLLPLAEALSHRWTSFNGEHWLNVITADVDHADWRTTLLDLVANRGLPMPLMTVQSPWKGTVHIVWLFERPIWKKCGKQLRFRKGISRALTLAFSACSRFGNALQKNPWHNAPEVVAADPDLPCGDPTGWMAYQEAATGTTYHTQVMGLGTVSGKDLLLPLIDLATESRVTLIEPRIGQAGTDGRYVTLAAIGEEGEQPRGTRLFHRAARTVCRAFTGDAGRILQIVERTAIAMNSPADRQAIEAISSSITTWMNTRWLGPLGDRVAAPGPGEGTSTTAS